MIVRRRFDGAEKIPPCEEILTPAIDVILQLYADTTNQFNVKFNCNVDSYVIK